MRNLSHTSKTLFIVCLIIIGLFSACQSQPTPAAGSGVQPAATGATGSSTLPATSQPPTATLPPTQLPTPSADEASPTIAKALFFLYTETHRLRTTSQTPQGEQQMIIEFIPPDRKHLSGSGNEYIVVGEIVYERAEDGGEWQVSQIPSETFLGDMDTTIEELAATIEAPRFLRQETLDGKVMLVFTYGNTTTLSGIELHTETEIWISAADGRPYQMFVDGDTLGVSTDPSTGASSVVAAPTSSTILIEFDSTIRVEQPAP